MGYLAKAGFRRLSTLGKRGKGFIRDIANFLCSEALDTLTAENNDLIILE